MLPPPPFRSTPYGRLVAGLFILVALAIAPAVRFFVTLRWSKTAGDYSVFVVLGFYCFACAMPCVRKISAVLGSWIALVSLSILAVVGWSYEQEARQSIAALMGLYDQPHPIETYAMVNDDTEHFVYEPAAFSIDVPKSWSKKALDLGVAEFSLTHRGQLLAELRPDCNPREPPLPTQIYDALWEDERTTHTCYRWRRGINACLLKRPAMLNGHHAGEVWRWLAEGEETRHALSLTFLLFHRTPEVERDIQRIITSAKPLMSMMPQTWCVRPAEWITY